MISPGARVFVRKSTAYFCPQFLAETGIYLTGSSVTAVVPIEDLDPKTVAQEILTAILTAENGSPYPNPMSREEWSEFGRPLFLAAGCKSLRAFEKGVDRQFSIRRYDGKFEIGQGELPPTVVESEEMLGRYALALITGADESGFTPDANDSCPDTPWVAVRGTYVGPLHRRFGASARLSEVKGWTIAVLGINEEVPSGADLAELLGTQVHVFAFHHVVEFYSWEMALPKRTVRHFVYSGEKGEILINVGTATAAEVELGLGHLAGLRSGSVDPLDLDILNEGTVLAIAKSWSVDPEGE